MLEFENQNIEFKQEYVPDIRKEIGFENAGGGTFYAGVRKDGAVLVIGNRWCSNHGRCCIPRYQFCHFVGIEKGSKKPKKREFNASGSFKGLSEDDHGKIYR